VTAATAAVLAQDTTPRLAFEVATIKRSAKLEDGGTFGFQPGGRFQSVNVPVIGLILSAYRSAGRSLLRSQVIGPDWLLSDRYDITAKVSDQFAAGSPAELYPKMPLFLQSFLEDRFKLKVHREMRELPIFVLQLARKDGVLGPQMRRSTVDCQRERAKCSITFLPGHVTAGTVRLDSLIGDLSGILNRVVVDRTTLEGSFDFDLEWSPDQTATDKPSIFAALQEQLGLKLESTKGPVDVLVIDHVERPTED